LKGKTKNVSKNTREYLYVPVKEKNFLNDTHQIPKIKNLKIFWTELKFSSYQNIL
jgi:hypothetical protein